MGITKPEHANSSIEGVAKSRAPGSVQCQSRIVSPWLTPPNITYQIKVMTTVFWTPSVYIDILQACRYFRYRRIYIILIKEMGVALKEKKKMQLSAALSFFCMIIYVSVGQAAIRECKSDQLYHPPNRPELTDKWLLYVSKLEGLLAWKEISERWWTQCYYRMLMWDPNIRLLFQRHRLLKKCAKINALK